MRAVEIVEPGAPDVLRVVERPVPQPQPGEAVVAVKAAGVSRADAMQRAGKYPPPPGASDIPGLEVSGTLVETGEPVCALLTGGGYSEFVAVPREQILPVPENWNFVEAATLPENLFTVYDNLVTRARFERGESVLIHGGSSGIGTTAIMLARLWGASLVVVTAGTAEKCAACMEIGADAAIDYHHEDFVDRALALTGGRGVDAILDIVGGGYIVRDVRALASDGRIACIATQGGAKAEIDLSEMMRRRASIVASSLRARSVQQKAAIRDRLLRDVWPLLPARRPFRPLVDSTFSLADAPAAHRRLEESAHIGKIVLTV